MLSEVTLLYSVLALSFLALETLFAVLESWHAHRENSRRNNAEYTVSVVIPVFNEPLARLRSCVESIIAQQGAQICEVLVVNDGSSDYTPTELEATLSVLQGSERITVLHLLENAGKREALAAGIRRSKGEILVTVDSDTILQGNEALRELCAAFDDPRVGGATGEVGVANWRTNVLTRLVSLRYWNAFHVERASQSFGGKMLCCSGPLSGYRRSILTDELLQDFTKQRFGGSICRAGDDRHLTNQLLERGWETKVCLSARCETFVPESLRSYLKQQVRWNRSFYREALWTMKHVRRLNLFSAYSLGMQILLPMLLTVSLSVVAIELSHGNIVPLVHYAGTLTLMGVLHSLYGLIRTRRVGFLLFPAYGVLHVCLLIPSRAWSLVTMGGMNWGTR